MRLRQWYAVLLPLLLLNIFDPTYSFLLRSHHKSIWPTRSRLLATGSSSSQGDGSSKTKPKKKIKKKKKRRKRFGTPRSEEPYFDTDRTNKSTDQGGAARKELPPPRFLVDYDLNRNPRTNKFRLLNGKVQCPHYPNCPSCVITERVGNIPIIESAKEHFSSENVRRRRRDVLDHNLEYAVESSDDGFLEVVIPSDLDGWRSQAKLVAGSLTSKGGRDQDGCNFGLYQKGSHRVIPIPACAAHHPSINKAVVALQDATRKAHTVAYSEKSQVGGLRYAQFRVERSTGKICLTLVWNSKTLEGTQPHLSRLLKELTKTNIDNYLWHSIWCHCNEGRGNAIFNINPNSWYVVTTKYVSCKLLYHFLNTVLPPHSYLPSTGIVSWDQNICENLFRQEKVMRVEGGFTLHRMSFGRVTWKVFIYWQKM